jgi:uncharacterized protein YicC (UPF0701 family)
MAKKNEKKIVKKPVVDNIDEEIMKPAVQVAEAAVEKSEEAEPKVEEISEETKQEETIDPQQVLGEFSDASKQLDDKLAKARLEGEDLKQVLESELQRAEETMQKLKENIGKREANLTAAQKNAYNKYWNGSTCGWYN